MIDDWNNIAWDLITNPEVEFIMNYTGFTHREKDWKKLFKKQDGCCAICGRHQADLRKTLSLDHNHLTGKIRGLLCHTCNIGIGCLKSDNGVEILEKAVEYTKKYSGG